MKNKKIVIIGAGLAGITLANKLANRCSVILLEKGDDSVKIPEKRYLKRSFGSSNTYCNAVGGTSHLWHNGLIDMPKVDNYTFNNILDNIEKYKDEAASVLNFELSYSEERKKMLSNYQNLFKDELEIDTILIPNKTPALKPNKAVKVLKNINVINFDALGDRITSVNFLHDKIKKKIDADYFIISAGGVGSPSIVNKIYSSIDEYNLDNIGNNFIDHPMGFVGKIKLKKKYIKMFDRLSFSEASKYSSRCGIVINNKGYKHIFYFRPAMTMNNSLALYKFKSKLGSSTWKERLKLIFDVKILHPDIIQEVIAHLFNIRIVNKYFSVWVVFEQKKGNHKILPTCDNEDIILWDISDDELQNYNESIKKFELLMSKYSLDMKFEKDSLSKYLWSAAHHSGSCSIGDSIGNVDSNLKLNKIKNVYVCDGSVIPSHAYSNTGLTIAQLSIRLAEYIKGL